MTSGILRLPKTPGPILTSFLLAWAVLAPPLQAGTPDLEVLLDRIHAEETGEMRFEEDRRSDLLEEDGMTLSGRLRFEPPNRLERHIEQPYRETQIITSRRVEIYRNNRRYGGFSLRRAPELEALSRTLVSLLTGDLETLEGLFHIELAENTEGWEILFTPKEDALADDLEFIRVAGREGQVTRLVVQPVDDDRIVTRLESLP